MSQFNFITAGESHGKGLAVIIEGLPAGLPIDSAFINRELWRRQQGYGRGGRMKIESDEVEILSGVRHGKTLREWRSFYHVGRWCLSARLQASLAAANAAHSCKCCSTVSVSARSVPA